MYFAYETSVVPQSYRKCSPNCGVQCDVIIGGKFVGFFKNLVMATLDVFVGNFTIIDFELYDLWLNGLSDVDAAHVLQKGELQHCPWVTIEDIVSEVHDHYRLFNHLDKILKNPTHLADQQIHQIDAEAQTLLIEKYYQFDEVVIREILGKKLSGRNRKDLR
ncbi:unnamed protein product [Mytilus coruscus]|uniref:Uncharacterized protein n=1 Tax=Mytilus coruscus TaxID=42192 RepID=A0A6J8C0Z4_MYTCO|nr:unnamed protein product [Mytilus coruscus]